MSSVRSAALDFFRAAGMTTIFGNPGSTELPLFHEFPDDFRYILGLQESIVVAMADGYAQASRSPALVNLHSAVGVGHAAGAIFTAHRNQSPLLITAGQQARALLPFDPFLYAERATEFPRPYIKWSCEPARAADVPLALARAHAMATQAPQGPVLVSIPVDDWEQPAVSVPTRTISQTQAGEPALLDAFIRSLDAAVRPVLVVGAGLARDRAWAETIALAERHQAPVWVAPLSARNSFPEDHPLFAGFLPGDRTAIRTRLHPYDVVAVLGAPAFTYHVDSPGPAIPVGSALLQLVDDPGVAAWTPGGLIVVGGLRHALQRVLSVSKPPSRLPPPRCPRAPAPEPVPLSDAYALHRLAVMRPHDSIVVEEAPSSRAAMHAQLPITQEDGFFTCASGGLGHGLPAAIGVALARPRAAVVAVLGDGSAMYAIQGLWTAVRLGLNITFIVINNRRYAALEHFAQHFGVEPLVGTDLPGLDFVALAKAQGCHAQRVCAASALDEHLARAFARRAPYLLEIVVE